jgi:4-alpha-glucanotransferase
MLCLISLQDWFSMDESLRSDDIENERINNPANANHYWRYRMHLNIEQLLQASEFNDKIRLLINRSARA